MRRNPELAEIAERVACWLPAFRYDSREPTEWRNDEKLIGGNGRSLSIRTCWRNNKMVTISGNAGLHSINCSKTRKPQDIAADITRRLLPQFEQDYAAKVEYDAKQDQRETELEVIRQGFERLGMNRRRYSDNNMLDGNHVTVEIKRYSGHECHLRITASPDDAMRIVGLLNTLSKT